MLIGSDSFESREEQLRPVSLCCPHPQMKSGSMVGKKVNSCSDTHGSLLPLAFESGSLPSFISVSAWSIKSFLQRYARQPEGISVIETRVSYLTSSASTRRINEMTPDELRQLFVPTTTSEDELSTVELQKKTQNAPGRARGRHKRTDIRGGR